MLLGREECKSFQVRVKQCVIRTKGVQRRPNIEWEVKRIEQVEEVEYLGTIMSANGKIDIDIKNMVLKKSKPYLILNKLNFSGEGKKSAITLK